MSDGAIIWGVVVSTILTNCVSDTELPEVSVAVHVTIVSPSGNDSGASLDKESISEISSVVNSPKSSIIVSMPVASIWISSGTTKIGFIVSTTLTICVLVDSLPDWSVTFQVTIVSPNGNISGASLVIFTSCISLIFGVDSKISLPPGTVASKVTSLRRIFGGVESITVTLWDDIPIFPDESITVHVTTVSPSGKTSGASLDNNITLTRSKTSGSINDTVFTSILFASIIISSGISTLGGVESIKVIFCCIVDIFPITSMAVHVT